MLAGLMAFQEASPYVSQEGYPKDGFGSSRTLTFKSEAEREGRLLLKELQSRSTVLPVFYSHSPKDWMTQPGLLPNSLQDKSHQAAVRYWKVQSMFVYVASPLVTNWSWEDIPDDTPVLTGSRRDTYEVIVVLTKSGKNLMAIEKTSDQSK